MRNPAGRARLAIAPSTPLASHTRRDLLRYLGAMAAVLAAPLEACGSSPQSPGFFTAAERSALAALADAVLPPDDTPGGAALGAVAYIERLLTAFDQVDAAHPPAIYGGGPFSGRAPFADPDGQPSTSFPPDSFSTSLPLDRLQDAAWRIRLFGSAGVPGGAPNDALLGAVVGLRDQVKQGLADVIQNAPQPLDQMTEDDLIAFFNTGLTAEFRQLVVDLVCQACFAPPEYGGNANLGGWALTHFEGDQQPLGFSVWSTAQSRYVERADAPVTTADATDPEPLSADVVALLDEVVALMGGVSYP